jgi:FMN phosphatase YigB (HAD superfamily)
MSKLTLLLDLDDTLLDTNMDAFIPAYFRSLSGALADVVAPEVMLAALMQGTQAMMANTDPALTLQEVFDASFFPMLGTERAALQERIDRFYEETFPTLGALTKPIPAAIRLVDWAFEQGHRIAIATNPFFPLKAVQHRLRWAGLPPEKYPFALVSSYETFHFAKEKVAYYPEVLAQLGWPDDPVVMVGDDVEREVKPTRAAGLPVFWIHKTGDISSEPYGVPQGTLDSLRDWIEHADLESIRVKLETPQSLLACLRATPAALSAMTAPLHAQAWTLPPAPEEWSLTEIICHLRDVESEVNLPRLQRLLTEENPFIVGEVTDVWAKERNYAQQDGPEALAAFTAARKKMISRLDSLQANWTRPARHAIFGPTTLQELIGFVAGHDQAHIQQVWKTIHAGE